MNEERFAKEMKKIQSVVSRALQKANTLTALADGGKMSREKLQLTLEETAYFFESATLYLRALCETQMPGIGGYEQGNDWLKEFLLIRSIDAIEFFCRWKFYQLLFPVI